MPRKDYLVDVRVYNNNLHQAIKSLGFTSIPKFCEAHELNYYDVNKLLAMKLSPVMTSGEIRPMVVRLLTIFNKRLDELFNLQQIEGLENNRSQQEVDVETLAAMMYENDRVEVGPEEIADQLAIARLLESAMAGLTTKERAILKMRFGIGGPEMSMDEIGLVYDLTGGRIRQITAKALTRLRHPTRAGYLRNALFGDVSSIEDRDAFMVAKAAKPAKVPEPPMEIRNVKGPSWDLRPTL